MKSSETSILVIAGHMGAGADHWQTRLISKLSSAQLVEQADWLHGSLPVAINALVEAVAAAEKPVVFVAHSVGASLVAHSVAALTMRDVIQKVRGAYLVVPPSETALLTLSGIDPLFANVPRNPLPFPSLLVATSNDPHSRMEDSASLALAWGSLLVEAGEAGHIDHTSGHGPWPEGMMRFAGFLSKLPA
jgi:uncharacterized protein